METINGEWIMRGCDSSDPSALHSTEELIALIHSIGFLPLFSNTISGFSVEERVPAYVWWTGDEAVDPWEWRMILARDPDIAYGKFFNKAAGFISKSFFPTFANYRRNGYDFDALFEDELESYRSRKVMDVFEMDDSAAGKELMTYEVKELAAVYKNFQGTLTDLQMQTYLILSDFRQRKNKRGQFYGWHIAAVETPETKWGRDFVTSGYKEDPVESWNRIVERVKQHFPSATDENIQKIRGIRWPGQSAEKSVQTQKKTRKNVTRKNPRPQELPWPENLITEIGLDKVFPATGVYKEFTNDQMVGLLHVMDELKEKEQTAIRLRYEEHRTLKEIADLFGLSRQRIRQFTTKGIRKLGHPARLPYIRDGYQGILEKRERQTAEIRAVSDKDKKLELLHGIDVMECGLSTRAGNALSIAGLMSLGDVAAVLDKDPEELLKVHNLGKQSLMEVVEKLEQYGVEAYEARRAYGFAVEPREDIARLNPSERLFNVLMRSGLDSIAKIENALNTDPFKFLRLYGMGVKTREELFEKLEKTGVDCKAAREKLEQAGY